MGVGYESESGAGVVAPRLGGWEARSKSRSTKRQVFWQRLRARHWAHSHTQHKLKKTGMPKVELSENVYDVATVFSISPTVGGVNLADFAQVP